MKIFFSHASQYKPTVKTIIKFLPSKIVPWIDEINLVWGDELKPSFEQTIKGDVEYLVLFISESAGRSEWVQKEVKWALEYEKQIGRTFLLPVVIQSGDENGLVYFSDLSGRKCIKIFDFSEMGLKSAADQIAYELFSLVCTDLEQIKAPKPQKAAQTISQADNLVSEIAKLVRDTVFLHRKNNPITATALYSTLSNKTICKDLDMDEFNDVLGRIMQRNLIPGLYYDGYELYLIEEHSLWKGNLFHDKKIAIARQAAKYISNGMNVFIDAGSTAAEIIKIICRRIETRTLTSISITTTSTEHMQTLVACCVKMGFDDDFGGVKLYIPCGKVRPNTQAIVPIDSSKSPIKDLCQTNGKFDIAFIGANGITLDNGITTHSNKEVQSKMDALNSANKVIILCDDSKWGIHLEEQLATWDDNFTLITNKNDDNVVLAKASELYENKIEMV